MQISIYAILRGSQKMGTTLRGYNGCLYYNTQCITAGTHRRFIVVPFFQVRVTGKNLLFLCAYLCMLLLLGSTQTHGQRDVTCSQKSMSKSKIKWIQIYGT